MENKNRINDAIEIALKNLNEYIDVDTVIGKPIRTENGEYIIPFSKVTLGILAGGGEYGKITIFKKNTDLPYTAGNGAVISIKPCGFLINNNKGEIKVLCCESSNYEKIIDKATNIFEKLYKNNESENN